MVKVNAERLPDAQVVLNIEVEPEALEKATQRAYQSLASRVKVPGFRPGKAPRHLVERYIGGADVLKQEGIERAIPEAYRAALQETDVRPIDQPEIEIVSTEPLVLKATVSVEPTVELGDYKTVRVPRVAVDVPYERINDTIERLREQHTEWVPVERPAQAGDRVTADVVGTIGAAPTLFDPSGQPIMPTEPGEPLIDTKNAEVEINPESTAPVPGFHEQLVGVAKGEKRFVLSLPADWPNEEQRSKSVLFHVVVHEVKEPKAPALDDEFAKSVAPEYQTLDQLREDIRERLRQQLEHDAEHQYEDTVIGQVVERSRIAVPPALIRRETERLVQNFERSLARQRLTLEQYLRLTNKTPEQMIEELRPQAETNLRSFLVLRELGQAEGVQVQPEEVEAELARIAEMVGGADSKQGRQLLQRAEEREDIEASLWHRKVVARLLEIAQQPAEDSAEAPAEPASDAAPAAQAGETPEAGEAAEAKPKRRGKKAEAEPAPEGEPAPGAE